MDIGKIVAVGMIVTATFGFAAETAKPATLAKPAAAAAETPKKPKMKLSEVINRKEGGFIRDTRGQKGCITIVNAQNTVSESAVKSSAAKFEKDSKFRFAVHAGEFDLRNPKKVGAATVYVISDATLPATLIAADDGWGAVNVAKLKSDKVSFTEARVRKAVVRVIGFLIGAADSQYDYCLTGKITSPTDYDQVPSEQLPMDVMVRFRFASQRLGITPWHRTTYRKACEQGWAPAPTNDIQKAIWDKVHSEKERGPVNGIKIAPPNAKK